MFDPEAYKISKHLSTIELDTSINDLISLMQWTNCEKVLDYGCGPGSITKKFLAPKAKLHNSIVHCVDISDAMIQYAQKEIQDENVKFFIGNIEDETFSLKEEKYDKVFAIHLLNWIKEPIKIIKKIYEHLNSDGYFGFIVGSGGYFQNKLLTKIAKDPKWNSYMQDYKEYDYMYLYDDPERVKLFYKELLESIGFKIIECENKDGGQDPVTLNQLTIFYKSLNPYLNKVPPELHADLEADYMKYLKQFLMLDNNVKSTDIVPHTHLYLSVVAVKN